MILAITASCSSIPITKQKPRAWFAAYDDPTNDFPHDTRFGAAALHPRPRAFAVGAKIDITASWSASCRIRPIRSFNPFDRGDGPDDYWDVEACQKVPHEAVFACDNPACVVERSDKWYVAATATLTAAGHYPMYVQFTNLDNGKRVDKWLPTVEAVLPDAAVVACATKGDDATTTVKVSLLHRQTVVPGSPALVLRDGVVCESSGHSPDHASEFRCPIKQPPDKELRLQGSITTPTLAKPFDVVCPWQP